MEKDNSGEGISKGSTRSRLQYVETAALLVLFAIAASTNFTTRVVAQAVVGKRVAVNGEVETLSPSFLTNEDALKKWLENTIRDAPPAGGAVTMLKHWPPKYAENESVGKIWILPAVVAIQVRGNREHEMVFLVYHVENQKGEIKVAWGIPDRALPLYLGGMSEI